MLKQKALIPRKEPGRAHTYTGSSPIIASIEVRIWAETQKIKYRKADELFGL